MVSEFINKAKNYREKVKDLEFSLETFDKLKKSYKGKKDDFGSFELHILHEAHEMLSAKQISKEQFATILTQAISSENTE